MARGGSSPPGPWKPRPERRRERAGTPTVERAPGGGVYAGPSAAPRSAVRGSGPEAWTGKASSSCAKSSMGPRPRGVTVPLVDRTGDGGGCPIPLRALTPSPESCRSPSRNHSPCTQARAPRGRGARIRGRPRPPLRAPGGEARVHAFVDLALRAVDRRGRPGVKLAGGREVGAVAPKGRAGLGGMLVAEQHEAGGGAWRDRGDPAAEPRAPLPPPLRAAGAELEGGVESARSGADGLGLATEPAPGELARPARRA